MSCKVFEDKNDRIWIVTKNGSSVDVKGRRETSVSLHEIARSCALKLGITETSSGIPLEDINEHRRIWNAIWEKGRST